MTSAQTLVTTAHAFPVLALVQLLPLGAALILLGVRREGLGIALGLTTAVAELALAGYLFLHLDHSSAALQFAERWSLSPALNYHVGVDGVSVIFILLTALLSLLVVIYAPTRRLRPIPLFLAVALACEATLMSLFTTMDLLWFVAVSGVELWLVGYLMGRWATSPAEDQARQRYYEFMGTGLALLLAGTLLLGWNHAAANAGQWSFDLTELAAVPVVPALSSLTFFLLFYGLAIRTPLFPLHGWLPMVAEHGNVAVAPVFLLGLKVGIYGLVRFVFPLLPDAVDRWNAYVVAFAAAGIFYAALLALMQTNLRRLLAYAVVSHTSVLIIGLFSLGTGAFQGAVMLSANFGMAIAGLLFMTGCVYGRTRTTALDKLGGLFDRLPMIGIAFFVAGLSIVGMPGTPGFDAVHLMLEAAIERFGALVTIAAALGNVAAAAFLLWAFQRAFLGPARLDATAKIPPATWPERVIAGVVILVLLGAGFYSEPWLEVTDAPLSALEARFGLEHP
jgi:NADH-quinone oxidoreductase subunit M